MSIFITEFCLIFPWGFTSDWKLFFIVNTANFNLEKNGGIYSSGVLSSNFRNNSKRIFINCTGDTAVRRFPINCQHQFLAIFRYSISTIRKAGRGFSLHFHKMCFLLIKCQVARIFGHTFIFGENVNHFPTDAWSNLKLFLVFWVLLMIPGSISESDLDWNGKF